MGYQKIVVTTTPRRGQILKLRDELLGFWGSITHERLIDDSDRDVYFGGDKVFLAGTLSDPSALRRVRRKLARLKTRTGSPLARFSIRSLQSGYLHDSSPCMCRKPAFLLLHENWIRNVSPIVCGSCNGMRALHFLPHYWLLCFYTPRGYDHRSPKCPRCARVMKDIEYDKQRHWFDAPRCDRCRIIQESPMDTRPGPPRR